MWWIVIVVIAVMVIAIILSSGKTPPVKKNIDKDYWDEKIMNGTLNRQTSYSKPAQRSSSTEPPKSTVDIEKYHSSNGVFSQVYGEYTKRYHESEGVFYNIDPADADDYILRYVVRIGNSELGVRETFRDLTLSGLVVQCEAQFKQWAKEVDKLNSDISSDIDVKKLQASRAYLSQNKMKLSEFKNQGLTSKYQDLLAKMQLRYNEILTSGNTVKEAQRNELSALGLNIEGGQSNFVQNSKKEATDNKDKRSPNLTFELKGLYYRSADAQLAAVLLEVGDPLYLEEEPDNEQDSCAVMVLTESGECIGYVDRECSALVSAMISEIESCTVIKRTRHQIPYITAKIRFKESK